MPSIQSMTRYAAFVPIEYGHLIGNIIGCYSNP